MRHNNQKTLTSGTAAEIIPEGLKVYGGFIQNLSEADVWIQIGAEEADPDGTNSPKISAGGTLSLDYLQYRYSSVKLFQNSGADAVVAFSFRTTV